LLPAFRYLSWRKSLSGKWNERRADPQIFAENSVFAAKNI